MKNENNTVGEEGFACCTLYLQKTIHVERSSFTVTKMADGAKRWSMVRRITICLFILTEQLRTT